MKARALRRTVAVLTAGLAVLGLAGPGLSQAAPTPGAMPSVGSSVDGQQRAAAIQQEMAWQLAHTPGGRQVGTNKIVWDKMGVELTLPMPGDKTTMANCAYRLVCVFGDTDYNNGPDVQPWVLGFYDCGLFDLGQWGRRNQASSWDNNQTPGTVAWIYYYRDENNTQNGFIQIQSSIAPQQDPTISWNDAVDLIRPC
ncbi:hypothetical protein ACIA49_01925 [Kribbella sp. NPDC051587]|uniref:hypothetical protein n=1 Tax=Kribbella sp. NPDC051587 TaxID=3364119 RepID=UPI0037B1A06C